MTSPKIFIISLLVLLCLSLQAQQRQVFGTVTDVAKEPLVGVTIMVQGTSKGTVTDIDGRYRLTLDGNAEVVFVFSYVGMKTLTRRVKEGRLDVVMQSDVQMVDEVVVTAYSVRKREKDLVGSYEQVSAEAQAELGNEPAARSDLNRIFLKANPSAQPIAATGEALKAEIMAERRRELAFEGHLLFDLARKRQSIRRMDCTASTCEMDYPDYRYVLPIPLDAILNNPALVQNEGYF